MLITVKYRGSIRFDNAYHAKIKASGNLFTHVFGKRGRTEPRTGGSAGEGSQRLRRYQCRTRTAARSPIPPVYLPFFPCKVLFWDHGILLISL